jgi:hypothetical protein
MILWLWGNLSGDFDHLGGFTNVRHLIDERKHKLSFLSIFLFSLVCVPANKPTYIRNILLLMKNLDHVRDTNGEPSL